MLILDLHSIGNNLYMVRKSRGLTQAEVAEKAEICDRTYADIERGRVTMRVDSLLKICDALNITPNDILVANNVIKITEQDFANTIKYCSNFQKF